jgi:steroid delta-isomerase-like uncharacterized protein
LDIIDRHFAAENSHDIPGVLATYTEDVVWDDVGHPDCPVHGKPAAAEMYHGIAGAVPDLHLETVRRFSAGSLVVDEAIATGHADGPFLGVDGRGAPVEFRILHVFELSDGLISREQAWFDTAGVIRQIESFNPSTD